MENKPTKLSKSNEYVMPKEDIYFGKEYDIVKEPISKSNEFQSDNEFAAEPVEYFANHIIQKKEQKKRDYTKLIRKMGYLVASTIAVVTLAQATNGTSNIPDDAIEFNGHYYKVYEGKFTWTEAKELCEELGGHLVVISSEEEQKFIETINHEPRWIGACRGDDMIWHWIANEEGGYSNWGEGLPDNSSNVVANENCLAVWPYKWNDLADNNLQEQNGYICEWDESTSEIKVDENNKETTTESIDFIIVADDTPGVNAATVVAVPKDYEQKYIKYEDMEPITMYGISSIEIYADFNATEGAFRIEGYLYEGDEFNIDGKGTYEGVEYYRVVRSENSFNPYHLVIPAEYLTTEVQTPPPVEE